MADGQELSQEQIVAEQQAEIQKNMALHLGIPLQQSQNVSHETNQGAQGGQSGNSGQQSQPDNEPPAFSFDTVKTQFGYETPEAMIEEIKTLRQLKEKPPVAEVQFENDLSKSLFEAVRTGKTKEVLSILSEQEKLAALTTGEITKENADEIVKAGMRLKYKGLSEDLINHQFNKRFAIPKEPVQDISEGDDEFQIRHQQWEAEVKDREMDKMIEANILRPELEAAKAKLVLPDISSHLDPDYLAWKQSEEEARKQDAITIEAYKAFKPADIVVPFSFIDEANNVKLESSFIADEESFKMAQQAIVDTEAFYAAYKNSDGSPNRQKYMRDMYVMMNWPKILQEAMNQVKNATIKRELPDNGNGSRGIVRDLSAGQQLSELDEYMKLHGMAR